MKKVLLMASVAFFFTACNNEKKEESKTEAQKETTSNVQLPYKANYSSQFNDNVSDSSVLTVLNSYKYWENADLNGLSTTLGDSVYFMGWDGGKLSGTRADIMKLWT